MPRTPEKRAEIINIPDDVVLRYPHVWTVAVCFVTPPSLSFFTRNITIPLFYSIVVQRERETTTVIVSATPGRLFFFLNFHSIVYTRIQDCTQYYVWRSIDSTTKGEKCNYLNQRPSLSCFNRRESQLDCIFNNTTMIDINARISVSSDDNVWDSKVNLTV